MYALFYTECLDGEADQIGGIDFYGIHSTKAKAKARMTENEGGKLQDFFVEKDGDKTEYVMHDSEAGEEVILGIWTVLKCKPDDDTLFNLKQSD